jgi:signal transduction histidine kinase
MIRPVPRSSARTTAVVHTDDVRAGLAQYRAGMRPLLSSRLAVLRPPTTDLLLAAGVTAVGQAEIWLTDAVEPKPLLAGLALLVTAPLAWRRRAPLAALLAVLGAYGVVGSGWPDLNPLYGFMAVVLAAYSVGAYAQPRRAALGGALVVLLFWVGGLLDNLRHPGTVPLGDFVFVTFLFGGAWLLGRVMGARGLQTVELQQRAARLEAEREAQAHAAVAAERARIARELHDVIAHSVSVMVVQAGAAEEVLEDAPERARAPLEAVQETGRQTIVELRRLLGILREDGQAVPLAPQPGIAHLDLLLEQTREAGLPVQLRIQGDPTPLPPGIDLAAYRIVQEALTNTLNHAGPAHAEVTVRYAERALELEVVDDGRGPPTNGSSAGGGHGLVGMRERAALYGGTLQAGPRVDAAGFAVRARLPREATAG